jgi:hypothetical protein
MCDSFTHKKYRFVVKCQIPYYFTFKKVIDILRALIDVLRGFVSPLNQQQDNITWQNAVFSFYLLHASIQLL